MAFIPTGVDKRLRKKLPAKNRTCNGYKKRRQRLTTEGDSSGLVLKNGQATTLNSAACSQD